MANRWWTDPVGLAGVDNATNASSPMNKPDLGFSITNEAAAAAAASSMATPSSKDEPSDKYHITEDPKEGALVVSPSRRPRGRPPGSKNKSKAPVFVTRDSPNVLRSLVMEVANGADIADSLVQFARKSQRGVCVFSATGTVANVTLREPAALGAVMTLHGRFEIISLTGSFLPGPSVPGSTGLTVYLAGAQAQVLGGGVVGPLVASGTVVIMAATFSNVVYEKLPIGQDEDQEVQGQVSGSGGGGGGEGSSAMYSIGGGHNNQSLRHNSNNNDEAVTPNYNSPSSAAGAGAGWGHARPGASPY